MKKYLSILAALLTGCFVATSCTDDEEDTKTQETSQTTAGVYVICSGNMSSQIDGSLTYFDYSAQQNNPQQGAFQQANGRSLGLTANDGVIYGSKFYIVVDNERTIEVIDSQTKKSLAQIKTMDLLGEKGVSPRHIVAHGGYIYVDTYGGVVAAIDTTNYALVTSYEVGSYPEGMAIIDNTLYVANSDYGTGVNPSISAIDLSTGKTETYTHNEINNPTSIVAIGNTLYIIDGDVYDTTTWEITKPGGLRKMENNAVGTVMVGETAMGANQIAAKGDSLLIVTDAYTDEAKLNILDTKTSQVSTMTLPNFGNVNAIGVDPISKEVFALCYTKPEGSQWADYSAPGICNSYNLANGRKNTNHCFQTGVGPTAIVFNVASTTK